MGNHVNPGTVPNLEDFIPPAQHDIYALGFQEMPGKGREQWVHEIKAHVMNVAGPSAMPSPMLTSLCVFSCAFSL